MAGVAAAQTEAIVAALPFTGGAPIEADTTMALQIDALLEESGSALPEALRTATRAALAQYEREIGLEQGGAVALTEVDLRTLAFRFSKLGAGVVVIGVGESLVTASELSAQLALPFDDDRAA
jgi:hypothetical protein